MHFYDFRKQFSNLGSRPKFNLQTFVTSVGKMVREGMDKQGVGKWEGMEKGGGWRRAENQQDYIIRGLTGNAL